VAACVAEVKKTGLKLDGIVANAGIMALPTRELSFGYERQFFTNHIGHFALVTGLLDRLAEDGRVVMLSSGAHSMAPAGGIEFDNLAADRDYSPWKQYGQSKFANLLFAKELARLFQGTKKTANAVHPGVIRTNLSRHMNPVARVVFAAVGPLFLKSVAQGAATQVWAATHPSLASTSGQYFADCNIARAREDSDNEATAKKLFEVSERIVAEVK
jgi:NAD(P)-dependent dehydrogenase (short-subunit alcohol dehydrogenase family)